MCHHFIMWLIQHKLLFELNNLNNLLIIAIKISILLLNEHYLFNFILDFNFS